MANIDIFSKFNLPKALVFRELLKPSTLIRSVSPFFTVENMNCPNLKLDTETCFVQKNVFSDLLQFFISVKEIIPNEKIVFQWNGLIQAKQTLYFIDDSGCCLIRDKLEFSLFNQFNFPWLDIVLSFLFYADAFIRHLRLKNVVNKELNADLSSRKDLSSIRSYIVINSSLENLLSLFDDISRFSLMAMPFLKIERIGDNNNLKEGTDFSVEFGIPFLPKLHCRVERKESKKLIISFSNNNLIFTGTNIWSFMPCENEFVIENCVQLEKTSEYLKLIWIVLGNLIVKGELDNWNKKLKEIVERTNLYSEAILTPA